MTEKKHLQLFLREVCDIPCPTSDEQFTIRMVFKSHYREVMIIVELESICLLENVGELFIEAVKQHFKELYQSLRVQDSPVENLSHYGAVLFFYEGERTDDQSMKVSFFNVHFICGTIHPDYLKKLKWDGFRAVQSIEVSNDSYEEGVLVDLGILKLPS